MYEVILHLSPRQKEAIEGSGLGNLLKIDNIHIDRNLCNEIARSYDKEKKAFNINEYLNLVDDVDNMRELNWSSLTLNQLLKGILKFREKTTNIEGNVCLLQVVDDIRGTIHCNEIPDEKAQDNDSETRSNEDFQGTSEEDVEQEQIDPREHVSNHNEESYINQNVNMTCETKDNSNQSNQSRKMLTGPTGRTYKPTNRTDFIYETRDLLLICPTFVELTKKEDPFITYINNTEDNKVMVHIEEVEVKRIRMKVLTQPEFLNDDVMDAYILCLRYKEKGIRGDGKAFLEMAMKTEYRLHWVKSVAKGMFTLQRRGRLGRWRQRWSGEGCVGPWGGERGGGGAGRRRGEEDSSRAGGGGWRGGYVTRLARQGGGGGGQRRWGLTSRRGDAGGGEGGEGDKEGLRRREAANIGGGGRRQRGAGGGEGGEEGRVRRGSREGDGAGGGGDARTGDGGGEGDGRRRKRGWGGMATGSGEMVKWR
uniref:Uncharacterized protein n=1 Tax=Oryza nivara TaxID=4536 RepID=A0A0E0IAJ1_ORYNI